MNKRDFYKELMSEYTFDKEKILANAKKGRLAGQKSLPIYIGMTAAAAAVIVGVGTLVMNVSDKRGGVDITPEGTIGALTAQERIRKALDEARKNENSSELHDVLVTFSQPLVPSAAQSVITQFSEDSVPVKMLIMDDGSRPMGELAIGSVFENGDGKITGMAINCPGYLISKINSSDLVFSAEIVDNEDLAGLALITTPEHPGIEDPTTNDPDNTGFGGGIDGDNTTSVDDEPGEVDGDDPNKSEDDPNSGSSENPETQDPILPAEKLPDGVTLPQGYEVSAYITDDLGADRAYFLSEDVFYVKTANSVRLYKWNGESESLAAQQTVADAKVCWVSENGSRLMITGVEDGVRGKMYIVDANNCTINDMKVENMVGDGSIYEAAYSEASDILALNILANGSYYIYTASLSGYQAVNEECAAAGDGLNILAAAGGLIYYADSYNGTTEICRYSYSDYEVIATLDGAYTVTANSAFTHAVMAGADGRFIFDPATESLIPLHSEGAVSFGVSAHSFSIDGEYYTVNNGELIPAAGLSTIAKIDFKRSFSSKYAAIVSNGSVRIVPSAYTSKAKSEQLVFDAPAENASPEARAAVNAGLGVINAIAGRSCRECGIDTAEKLSKTVDVCFAKDTAAALKTRCEISVSGNLSYSKGGLSAVNISDTILVMQDGINGTLYIKAGTFDGKAAYFARSVKLSEENGSLKLDCIID